jgi:hypothetical protein
MTNNPLYILPLCILIVYIGWGFAPSYFWFLSFIILLPVWLIFWGLIFALVWIAFPVPVLFV